MTQHGNVKYEEGYTEGDGVGYERGYNSGKQLGLTEGEENGYVIGLSEGKQKGRVVGDSLGFEKGYQAAISQVMEDIASGKADNSLARRGLTFDRNDKKRWVNTLAGLKGEDHQKELAAYSHVLKEANEQLIANIADYFGLFNSKDSLIRVYRGTHDTQAEASYSNFLAEKKRLQLDASIGEARSSARSFGQVWSKGICGTLRATLTAMSTSQVGLLLKPLSSAAVCDNLLGVVLEEARFFVLKEAVIADLEKTNATSIQVRNIVELMTLSYTQKGLFYENEYVKKGFIFDDKYPFRLIMDIEAKIGFKLDQSFSIDVNDFQRQIIIRLPRPFVTLVGENTSVKDYLDTSDEARNKYGSQAIQDAKKAFIASVGDNSFIINSARKNAAIVLTDIFSASFAMLRDEYQIVVKFDGTNQAINLN